MWSKRSLSPQPIIARECGEQINEIKQKLAHSHIRKMTLTWSFTLKTSVFVSIHGFAHTFPGSGGCENKLEDTGKWLEPNSNTSHESTHTHTHTLFKCINIHLNYTCKCAGPTHAHTLSIYFIQTHRLCGLRGFFLKLLLAFAFHTIRQSLLCRIYYQKKME